MAFACLFVPDFPVQAVIRLEPELRDKPVAVLEGEPPLTKVFAINAAARNLRLEEGMTKIQAEAFEGIVWRRRSLSQEATAHAVLRDCAWTISPRVQDKIQAGEEALRDAAILDITGCEKLFGAPDKIASDLLRIAKEVGLAINVAIAANPQAALYAARGFAGITVIPEDKESLQLGTLSLASLKFPLEFVETLSRWGIHTCAEFAALPEVAVVERFGQEGRKWYLIAKGSEPTPLIADEPPAQFEEHFDLEFPLELLEPLLFVLNRLLEQLCVRLRMHVLAASEVNVTLTLQPNDSRNDKTLLHIRTIRLPVPAKDSKFLLKLLQLDLQTHPPGSPVIAVGVAVVPANSRTRQLGLFLPLSPEPEQLQITLARIRKTVGEERVGNPVLLDTHRPDAFRQSPFVLPEATMAQTAVQRQATTALRIYRPPLPVFVELDAMRPTQIVHAGVRRCVLAFAGPWRTKGDWWSETVWARDEWDVLISSLHPRYRTDYNETEEEETALYRIYRDLRSKHWFVEGVYD